MPENYAAVAAQNKGSPCCCRISLSVCRVLFFLFAPSTTRPLWSKEMKKMIRQPMSQNQRLTTETVTCLFNPKSLVKKHLKSSDLCFSFPASQWWYFTLYPMQPNPIKITGLSLNPGLYKILQKTSGSVPNCFLEPVLNPYLTHTKPIFYPF